MKQKKCKGTRKAIGYGCGKVSYLMRYGLCKQCFIDWLYNTPEGKETLSKTLKTARNKMTKEKASRNREWREKNKSIQKLIQEARKPFQAWIRMRDANKPCISCGSIDSDIYDAGHFYKAEIYSGLIFDEDNVHKQCRKCNTYLDGNDNEYRKGLINRFGNDFVLALDKKAIESRSKKYERDELIQIKNKYQTLINNKRF